MFVVNEATWDRAARVALGAAMLVAGWGGYVGGTGGEVLKYLGVLPLLTGVIGYCPAYGVCHVSTASKTGRG